MSAEEYSDDELLEMWRRFYDSGRTDVALRDKLTLHYWPLAKRFAGKMGQNYPKSVDRDDLESWATRGLMRAVMFYDPIPREVNGKIAERPAAFSTFALACMRSVILDELRRLDWAPRSLRKRQRDIDKMAEKLAHEMGKTPSEEAVAEQLGITVDDLRRTRQETAASWHTYLDDVPEHEEPAVRTNDDELEVTIHLRGVLVEQIEKMTQAQRVVIALHYFEELPLNEVAALIGLPEATVSLHHRQAVGQVWRAMVSSLGADLLPFVGDV